jgi:hypothetical protein
MLLPAPRHRLNESVSVDEEVLSGWKSKSKGRSSVLLACMTMGHQCWLGFSTWRRWFCQ